jgi:hypothetical protein
LTSCSSFNSNDTKEISVTKPVKKATKNHAAKYVIIFNGTLNELRFYNITSALDTRKTMYIEFGKWQTTSKGMYQQNIDQKIWNKIVLFKNEPPFTIITDGTETTNDYFSGICIIDSTGRDCFEQNHAFKEKIMEWFSQKMMVHKTKKMIAQF